MGKTLVCKYNLCQEQDMKKKYQAHEVYLSTLI